jgi:hypothetical protein
VHDADAGFPTERIILRQFRSHFVRHVFEKSLVAVLEVIWHARITESRRCALQAISHRRKRVSDKRANIVKIAETPRAARVAAALSTGQIGPVGFPAQKESIDW